MSDDWRTRLRRPAPSPPGPSPGAETGTSLVESAPDILCRIGADGRIRAVSPAVAGVLGTPPPDILGCAVLDRIHPDDRFRLFRRIATLLTKQAAPPFSVRMHHADGEFHWLEIHLGLDPDPDGAPAFVAVARDITAWKAGEELLQRSHERLAGLVAEHTRRLETANRILEEEVRERITAEVELKQSREELRSLSAHLQAVREAERTRIAREIHDELGQVLSALKMDIDWLRRHGASDVEAFAAKAEAMNDLVKGTLQRVKRISQELRPSVLDNLGFLAALRWQSGDFAERSGIECTVSMSGAEPPLSHECASALFRVCQEALTNVARHAGATAVKIAVATDGDRPVLRIRDDGRGITVEDQMNARSFGLVGMRERVHHLNGRLTIDGEPGAGTTISVTVPLNEGNIAHDPDLDR